MKIRIGHLSTFYHTAVLLMARPDFLERLAAEVEWRLFGTGPAIVNAMEKGEIDLAYIGLPPAIIGIERGVKMKCVAGGHVEGTVFSGRAAMKGYPEIGEIGGILKQLQGRKIGVPGSGSIHDVILRDCLYQSGMQDDIQVGNFRWADEAMESFVRNEIDAVFGTPALAVAVHRFSDGKILFPPSLLRPNNPSYGIVVTSAFMEKDRGMVSEFIRAHEEAARLTRENPHEAAGIIAGQVGFVDAGFVHEVLMVSPKYCAQLTEQYIRSTMEFSRILKLRGYIGREVSREEIFDTSLIGEVHPPGDHYGAGAAEE